MSRAVHAAIRGGEEELFLHKCETILDNAEFRLKHRIGVSEAALAEIYKRWHPDLEEWIEQKSMPGKNTLEGFMAAKEEIDLIKSMMKHFNYPEEPRSDLVWGDRNDPETMARAVGETRFRAALDFWDKYFHRFVVKNGKAYFVIPPSQHVGDNYPVVVNVPIEAVVVDLMREATIGREERAMRMRLKRWNFMLLAIIVVSVIVMLGR